MVETIASAVGLLCFLVVLLAIVVILVVIGE